MNNEKTMNVFYYIIYYGLRSLFIVRSVDVAAACMNLSRSPSFCLSQLICTLQSSFSDI